MGSTAKVLHSPTPHAASSTEAQATTGPEARPVPATSCEHQNAEPQSWPWLPTERKGLLAKHPWCRHCGSVASSGDERALDYGGLVNTLAHLQRRLELNGRKLTEVQKRLILQRLRNLGADDRYGLDRKAQIRVFYQTVEALTGINATTVHSYLHAC